MGHPGVAWSARPGAAPFRRPVGRPPAPAAPPAAPTVDAARATDDQTTKDGTSREQPIHLHLGVRDRGAPRQDGRPDLGLGPRRAAGRRPRQPGGLRDAADHRPGAGGRGDHHHHLRRHPEAGAPDRPRHRVRRRRLRHRRQHLRRDRLARRAVAQHRPGRRQGVRGAGRHRRRGPAQRPGRRRPGDDVRLRLRRDARTSCRCRSGWPTAWPSAWPRSAGSARCRTCAPTARPR